MIYTTGGSRRAVIALNAKTGELKWVYSLAGGRPRGKRAASAFRTRRLLLDRRQGRRPRILYITTGYRLVELNAHTGRPIEGFGDHGIIDMKVGAYKGSGQQIDLTTGEIGLHTTPTVVDDVVIVGSAMKEGSQPLEVNNNKGIVRAWNVRTGKLLWTFHTIPKKGRARLRQLGNGSADRNGNVGVWTGITVDPQLNSVYLAVEDPDQRLLWRRQAGRQSILRQPGLRGSQHRQEEVVLPDRAPRDLGL